MTTSFIINHLWQSSCFVLLAGFLASMLRQNSPKVRFWIWLSASAKFLVPLALLVSLGSMVPRPARQAVSVPVPVVPNALVQIAGPFSPASVSTVRAHATIPWVPISIGVVWAIGFLAITVARCRSWLGVRAAVQAGTPVELCIPVRVLTTPRSEELGVVGFLRPVLILPIQLFEHLNPGQLDAVLMHELCHVRRRDNLFAALHMAVEAIFWFHPLVWWIGSRMVEERELACDEEVLRMGCDPSDYVEGILRVCRFYTESPLPCVSGVTGSDVKKRLRAILAGKVAHKLSLGRKAGLAALGLAALVAPVAIGILNGPAIRAQTSDAHPQEFEAASIKLIPCPGSRCGGGAGMERLQFTPIRASSRPVQGISARGIILEAYHLRFDQLSGGPSWLDSDRFELEAVTASPTDRNQMRRMLQNLVAERFKLVLHRETKDTPVYFLTVGKKGAKLRERKDDDDVPDPSPGWRGIFIVSTMEQFIANIRNFGHLDRPVLDKTGLDGVYYFVLDPQALNDDVKSAVEDTFGLKFEPRNAPAEVFTIDHVEKPSPN